MDAIEPQKELSGSLWAIVKIHKGGEEVKA